MSDEIGSPPSDYSRVISDASSTLGYVAADLKAQCAQVLSTSIPGPGQHTAIEEYKGLLFIGNAKGAIVIRDINRNELLDTLNINGSVVALRTNGEQLGCLSSRPSFALWGVPNYEKLKEIHVTEYTKAFTFGSGKLFIPIKKEEIEVFSPVGERLSSIHYKGAEVTAMEYKKHATDLALVVGCTDGSIHIINVDVSELSSTLNLQSSPINFLKVTPEYILCSSTDRNFRAYDAHARESVVIGSESPIMGLAVTPDNKYIVTVSADKTIKVSNLGAFETRLEIKNADEQMNSVLVSSDCRFIITMTSETIKAWYLSTSSDDGYYIETRASIDSFCLTAEKGMIVTATENTVVLYDSMYYSKEQVLQLEKRVTAVASNEELIAAGVLDGSVFLWTVGNYDLIKKFTDHSKSVRKLVFIKNLLYSSSEDFTVKVWDTGELGLVVNLTQMVGPVMVLSENWMVTSIGSSVLLWDIKQPRAPTPWGKVTGHTDTVMALDICEKDKIAVSAGADCTIRVITLRKSTEKFVLKHHSAPITNVKIHEQYGVIISSSEDFSVFIWSFFDMQVLLELTIPGPPISMLLDPMYGNVLFSTDKGIYILKSPLQADKLYVYPSKYSTLFRYYVYQLLSNKKPKYNPEFVTSILFPYRINLLHLLVYAGHVEALTLALQDHAPFMKSEKGETPITLAIQRRNRLIIDTILSYVVSSGNIGVWRSIEEVVHTLNKGSLPSLCKVYEAAFPVAEQDGLPNFGIFNSDPPIIHLAKKPVIDSSNFIDEEGVHKGVDECLEFRQSLIGLNLKAGSLESLLFMKSLAECENLSVFSTLFIVSIVNYKWDKFYWFIQLDFIANLALVVLLVAGQVLARNSTGLFFSILILAVLQMSVEVLKVLQLTVSYFLNLVNVLNFIRLLFAIIYSSMTLSSSSETSDIFLLTVLTLFTWMKVIFQLRMYEGFRLPILYFESMLKQLKYPLLVIALMMLAMGITVSFSSYTEDPVGDYLSIAFGVLFSSFFYGDSTVFESFNILQWLILIGFCVILPVILFNMLLAMAIHTYATIRESYSELRCKDMVHSISELETILFWRRNKGRRKLVQQCSVPDYYINLDVSTIKEQQLQYKRILKNQKRIRKHYSRKPLHSVEDEIKDIKDEILVLKEELKHGLKEITSQLTSS